MIIKQTDLRSIKIKLRDRNTSTLFFENHDGPYRVEYIRHCLHISKYGDGRRIHVPGCLIDKFKEAVYDAHKLMKTMVI